MNPQPIKPTSTFLGELPREFWEEQYRFSKICIELGTKKKEEYASVAVTTGDWAQANIAFKFVEFWEGKYHEAQQHLRALGLIA